MVTETILGLIAATLTTIAFVPQAWKAIKTKNTKDLSLSMYVVLTTGIALWLVYGVIRQDLPIMVANGITLLFTATILIMKLRYK